MSSLTDCTQQQMSIMSCFLNEKKKKYNYESVSDSWIIGLNRHKDSLANKTYALPEQDYIIIMT